MSSTTGVNLRQELSSASGRTKHFERWITYVRDLYQRKIVVVSHLKTDEMPADIFTKPLPTSRSQSSVRCYSVCSTGTTFPAKRVRCPHAYPRTARISSRRLGIAGHRLVFTVTEQCIRYQRPQARCSRITAPRYLLTSLCLAAGVCRETSGETHLISIEVQQDLPCG